MKKLLTLGILLVACAVSMGQTHGAGGLRPGLQESRLTDLTVSNTSARRVVNDPLPRVCVIFWDGRANAWGEDATHADAGATYQIQAYLRRGIPISMGLNARTIGNAPPNGKLTWAEIRDVQAYASANGTEVEMFQHSNSNLNATNIIENQTTGWDSLYADLNPNWIEANLGVDVNVFAPPGDPGRREFLRRNHEVVSKMLKDLGINYGFASSANADSMPGGIPWIRTVAGMEAITTHTSTNGPGGQMALTSKAGTSVDPYFIYAGGIGDQGTNCVERDGLGAGRIIDSDASDWTYYTNGLSNGASSLRTAAYFKPAQYVIYSALSNNIGFAVSIHDSTNTDDLLTTAGINATGSIGHFSPDYLAALLKALEDAGHLKLVTVTEYCEWSMSEYAVGLDLIGNPSFLMPQADVGDTVGLVMEYPWARGFSSANANRSAFDATQFSTTFWMRGGTGWDLSPDTELCKFDTANDDPYDNVSSAFSGWRGRPGGAITYNGLTRNGFEVLHLGLQPGHYRWSITAKKGAASSSTSYTLEEMHLNATIKWYKPEASMEDEGAFTYGDTVLTYGWKDGATTINVAEVGEWQEYSIEFYLPERITGDFSNGSSIWSAGSAATGEPILYGATNERVWINRPVWAFGLEFRRGASTDWSMPALRYLGKR